MTTLSTRAAGAFGGGPAGDDGPEYQVAGHQIPQVVVDGGLVNLTAVDGLRQDVADQTFALIEGPGVA